MVDKTYTITQSQISKLSDAISLLDWIKNRLPDESPEKTEASVRAMCCHAMLEALLDDDAPSVYGPEDPEEEPTT